MGLNVLGNPINCDVAILLVVTKDLPISPRFSPYDFLSRCKFSSLTTRQPTVECYLLALSATDARIQNPALTRIELTTFALFSRCARLTSTKRLDHSGTTINKSIELLCSLIASDALPEP